MITLTEPGLPTTSHGGVFNVPGRDLGVLGDVRGLDVIELGCGTAYFSAWLARREACRLVTAQGGPEFHPGHGEWITILRASGFTIDDLREIYAPPDTADHPCYQLATAEWARQWPVEEIWVAHLEQ